MSPREEDDSTLELIKSSSMLSLAAADECSEKLDRKRSMIQFGYIEVREYNRIVGDHPDVKVGPPMSIGWEFSTRNKLSIDEYEETRPKRRSYLRMSSITRKNMLHNVFGIPEEEIAAAEYEVQKIRRHRDQSNKQGKSSAKVESGFLSFRRKLRRSLSSENLMKGVAAASGSMFAVGIMHA